MRQKADKKMENKQDNLEQNNFKRDSRQEVSNKTNTVIISAIILIAILGAIFFLSYKGTTTPSSEKGIQNQTIHAYNSSLQTLNESDVLVSFRLDDITFAKSQKPVLQNALYLAHKYNITFDLAVIAQPFDKNKDNATFKIYQDNQDVFEVVAHGLTHANPINSSHKGEFFDTTDNKPIHPEIQENHIRKMKEIFEKHNLTIATKIFAVSWNAGDNDTIKLAEEYGYKLITQTFVPNKLAEQKYGMIIVSKEMVGISANQTLSDKDIQKALSDIKSLIKENQTKIQIITHPVNYLNDTLSIDKAISEIVNNSADKSRIKFSFISDRFANEK